MKKAKLTWLDERSIHRAVELPGFYITQYFTMSLTTGESSPEQCVLIEKVERAPFPGGTRKRTKSLTHHHGTLASCKRAAEKIWKERSASAEQPPLVESAATRSEREYREQQARGQTSGVNLVLEVLQEMEGNPK